MFGYIYVNRKELSEEDRKDYQSYYCGLCQALRKSSGVKGQVLLNYDMTFLIILLSGLYELENKEEEFFCPLHPREKEIAYINEVTQYASDMNVLLSYHNLLDDWQDEKNYAAFTAAKALEKYCDTHRGIVSAPDESSAGLPRKAACMREGKQSRPRSCGRLYRRGDGGDLYSGGGHLER